MFSEKGQTHVKWDFHSSPGVGLGGGGGGRGQKLNSDQISNRSLIQSLGCAPGVGLGGAWGQKLNFVCQSVMLLPPKQLDEFQPLVCELLT